MIKRRRSADNGAIKAGEKEKRYLIEKGKSKWKASYGWWKKQQEILRLGRKKGEAKRMEAVNMYLIISVHLVFNVHKRKWRLLLYNLYLLWWNKVHINVFGKKKIKNKDRRCRQIRRTNRRVKVSLGHIPWTNRWKRRKIQWKNERNNEELTRLGHGGERIK